MKDFCKHASIGWACPQIKIQITPLQWHLAVSWYGKNRKLAFAVGPFAICFWFNFCDRFSRETINE